MLRGTGPTACDLEALFHRFGQHLKVKLHQVRSLNQISRIVLLRVVNFFSCETNQLIELRPSTKFRRVFAGTSNFTAENLGQFVTLSYLFCRMICSLPEGNHLNQKVCCDKQALL